MCEENSGEKSPGGDQFVSRLFGLPIMATAVGQLSSFYSSTKERNQLLKLALETAESGVGVIVSTAVPVVSIFDKEIVALNVIACTQLDFLEGRCPIITKPTEEVVKETKDLCYGAVQPVVSRVNSVKNYSYDRVNSVKNYSYDRVNSVKNYGYNSVNSVKNYGYNSVNSVRNYGYNSVNSVRNYGYNSVNSVKNYSYNKVSGIRAYTGEKITDVKTYGMNKVTAAAKVGSDQVTRVLSTPVCRGVVNKCDVALDVADRYVDDYLPSEHEVDDSAKKASQSDVVLLSKAYQLGSKVQRRLYGRAMKRLRGVQLRARETIGQLNHTVNLIEYARSNFNGAQDKLHYYWQEVNKMEDQVAEDATNEQIGYYDSNFERKAIATARQLTRRLKSTLLWVDTSSVASIPAAVRGKLGRLQDMVHSLSEVFSKEVIKVKGLPNSALDNARNTMVQLYAGLSDLVDWTVKNSPSSSLISRLLGYDQSNGAAGQNENDSEKTDIDSESQEQKEEDQEAKTDDEPAMDEDHWNEITERHQRDAEEDEEEVEEEEENSMNGGTVDCDPAKPQQSDGESSNNLQSDEGREDTDMEKTEKQLKEEDVKEDQTGVDLDKGENPDGCNPDLEKSDSESEKLNESDVD